MNAGELLQRLWPRAPNHVLNIVVLKLSLLFTIQPKSSDVRFRQLQSRRLNARNRHIANFNDTSSDSDNTRNY